jgi:SPP1 family predicted phage head-tail adaptor
MNASNLDRRIKVQVRSVSQDQSGGRVETWTDSFDAWAELVRQVGGESEIAGADKPSETAIFRIRYVNSIASNTHRISWNSKIYDILHIAEEGRRDGLLITCRTILSIP